MSLWDEWWMDGDKLAYKASLWRKIDTAIWWILGQKAKSSVDLPCSSLSCDVNEMISWTTKLGSMTKRLPATQREN
jgi:hypothetical protein